MLFAVALKAELYRPFHHGATLVNPGRYFFKEDIHMWHYFAERVSLAPDAVVGVGLIGIYFVWILGMAFMRIRNGDHMHH